MSGIIQKIKDDLTKDEIIDTLKEDLKTTNLLFLERQRLLDAIPECPVHGKCVPYALEWISAAKNKLNEVHVPNVMGSFEPTDKQIEQASIEYAKEILTPAGMNQNADIKIYANGRMKEFNAMFAKLKKIIGKNVQ